MPGSFFIDGEMLPVLVCKFAAGAPRARKTLPKIPKALQKQALSRNASALIIYGVFTNNRIGARC